MKSELNCLFFFLIGHKATRYHVQSSTVQQLKCLCVTDLSSMMILLSHKNVLLAEKCVPGRCHLVQDQSVEATHDVQILENIHLVHMVEIYSSRLREHRWYRLPNGIGNKSH